MAGLAALAAGCGSAGSGTTTRTTTAQAGLKPCLLSAGERAKVAAARREIAVMHRAEAPLTKWKPTGPTAMELAVERFLLDVGSLPVTLKGDLIDKAKASVGLCGDCFQALEAEEPVPATRLGGNRCRAR